MFGISPSSDRKRLPVVDDVNKEGQIYDVSRVSEGVAPTQLGVIPVAGLSGTTSHWAYDCGRGLRSQESASPFRGCTRVASVSGIALDPASPRE